jgi:hypothetical protein
MAQENVPQVLPVRCYDRREIKTPLEQFAADLCREAGVRYRGIQKGFGVLPDQILFDNSYRSTLCIPVPGATVDKIHELAAASNSVWSTGVPQ